MPSGTATAASRCEMIWDLQVFWTPDHSQSSCRVSKLLVVEDFMEPCVFAAGPPDKAASSPLERSAFSLMRHPSTQVAGDVDDPMQLGWA